MTIRRRSGREHPCLWSDRVGEDGTTNSLWNHWGEVILNVHGKRSRTVAALIDGIERDFSHVLDSDCSLEPINGESEEKLYILRILNHFWRKRCRDVPSTWP